MAAIWSPPMKSCPVFSAVDIAKTISSDSNDTFDEIETASSIGSLGSFNSSQTGLNHVGCLSEDDALKIILKKKHKNDPHDSQDLVFGVDSREEAKERDFERRERRERRLEKRKERERGEPDGDAQEPKFENEFKGEGREDVEVNQVNEGLDNEKESSSNADVQGVGNSLIGKLGWSTSYEDCESSLTSSVISRNSDSKYTPAEGPTYDALIKSYNPAGYGSSPDLQELIDTYPLSQPVVVESTAPCNEKVI